MNETFQFPLPLLANGENQEAKLSAAISYACITTGRHRLKVLSPLQIEQELSNVKLPKRNHEISVEEIRLIALGCVFCNVNQPQSTSQAIWRFKSYQAAEVFLQSWKAAGRTAPWTRVPTSMAFEARDGTAKVYQRFAALCAVNAAIGSKPFAIVTRNRVRAGMLGYSSGKLLFGDDGNLTPEGRELLNSREDQQREAITVSQTRTLLDNLVKTSLLHRFTPPKRGSLTYYSKSLPAELIAEALIRRAQRTASTPKLKQLGEMLLRATQGEPLLSGEDLERSPLNTTSPLNKEITTQSPPSRYPITTQSPHNASSYAAFNAAPNASKNAGASAPTGLGKKDGGLLTKDRARIQLQIQQEKDKSNPDREIIAGLRSELETIDAELRTRGKSIAKLPVSLITTRADKPKLINIHEDLTPEQREQMKKQLRDAIKR